MARRWPGYGNSAAGISNDHILTGREHHPASPWEGAEVIHSCLLCLWGGTLFETSWEEGDFQEECALSDETSIPIYCKQWALLKAHLHFPIHSAPGFLFSFLKHSCLVCMRGPHLPPRQSWELTLRLSENWRLREFSFQNKTSVL